MDKVKYHFFHKTKKQEGKVEAPFYLRLIHTIESLLQIISDQQLVAGIALLAVINVQACEISAYHYNIVCTMLLLSAVTHLNTLINISDFIYKGKTVATQRLIAIFVQITLSGIVLSARNSSTFPSKASPLSILPAACFENMNATNYFGLADFATFAQNVTAGDAANSTANATQILHNIESATTKMSGLGEYVTLVVLGGFAIVFIGTELLEALFFKDTYLHWFSIALSTISVVSSTVITAVATTRYNNLRGGMEIDAWYDIQDEQKWTYSQLFSLFLLGSGSITLVKAITGMIPPCPLGLNVLMRGTESIAGHRARRYEQAAQRAANQVLNTKAQVEQATDEYNLVQQNASIVQDNFQFAKTTYDGGYGR